MVMVRLVLLACNCSREQEDFAQYDYITLGDTVEERLQNILAN
jgi:hypothetical protein